MQDSLLKILQYVDSNRSGLVKNLADAVAIKSIAGSLKYEKEVLKMIKFVEGWLVRLGVKYECFHIGSYKVDGKVCKLPPIILGAIGSDVRKPTVSIFFMERNVFFAKGKPSIKLLGLFILINMNAVSKL